MDLPILDVSCKWNHTICNLSCLALFSLCTMFSRLIYVRACVNTFFFLLMNNIPLYVCIQICLFISLWTFGLFLRFGYCEQCCYEHLYLSFWLNTCFQFVWYLYPGMEFLGPMAIPYLNFWGTATLFSKMAALFHVSTRKMCEDTNFSHPF